MTGRFRVPKHAVPADVILIGHPPMSLRLFLAELAETHAGPERPSDLVNSKEVFLPAFDTITESVVLISRETLMVLSTPIRHEVAENVEESAMDRSEERVVVDALVTLREGVTVRGTIGYVMPEGQRRLQDFLNTEDPFVLIRDGDQARFVNKHHIVKIETTSKP